MHLLISVLSCNPAFGSEALVGFKYAEALAGRFDVTVISSPPSQTPPGATLIPCDAGPCTFNDVGAASLLRFELRQHRLARRLARSSRFNFVHRLTPSAIQQPTWTDRVGLPLIVGPLIAANPPPAAFAAYLDRPVTGPSHARFHPSRILARLCRSFVRQAAGRQRHLEKASRIVLGTRTALSRIPERLRNKCRLLTYSGVEHELFAPCSTPAGPSTAPLRLLFVGRLVPYKGVELLVRAAALASKRCPLHLDIVCSPDPDFKTFLLQLARDLGLLVEDFTESVNAHQVSQFTDHTIRNTQYGIRNALPSSSIQYPASSISFLPPVPRSQLPALYQQCDVFCFPTLCDTYGIALLEAMSCGCAVLVSDVAGAGEIINGENGLKVPLTSPDQYIAEYAENIVACARNPDFRVRLGSTARQ